MSVVLAVSAPLDSEHLGYSGEHTSLLYALAPLWHEAGKGNVPGGSRDWLARSRIRYFARRNVTDSFWNDLEAVLRDEQPRVVAVSMCTASAPSALRVAEYAKRYAPESVVVFGGPHEDDLRWCGPSGAEYSRFVDISVSGDGEYALLQIVSEAMASRKPSTEKLLSVVPDKLRHVAGSGAVTIRTGASFERIELRGSLPDGMPCIPRALLARDAPELARGFNPLGNDENEVRTAQITTERGCAWRCSFCSEWRGSYRRTIEDVKSEIEEALGLGYSAVWFEDSTFFYGFGVGLPHSARSSGARGLERSASRVDARQEFIHQLFEYLAARQIEWGCQTRVDTITPRLAERAFKAGCRYIYFGAESASDTQLNDMRKGQTHIDIERALQHVRNAGIRIGVSTLFGMPSTSDTGLPHGESVFPTTSETLESARETVEFFSREIRKGGVVTVSRNVMAFYPGSTRSRELASSGQHPDFWVGQPYAVGGEASSPWNKYEDGAGYHAEGMTGELASQIAEAGDAMLGPWSIKAYIHAASQHRAPGRIDLVNYTKPSGNGSTFSDVLGRCVKKAVRPSAKSMARVFCVGMHILEAVRTTAYIRSRGTASRAIPIAWEPNWTVHDASSLIAAIRTIGKKLRKFKIVAIPLVIPETGAHSGIDSAIAELKRLGFSGHTLVDISDAVAVPHALDSPMSDVPRDSAWICDLNRTLGLKSELPVFSGKGFDHASMFHGLAAKSGVSDLYDILNDFQLQVADLSARFKNRLKSEFPDVSIISDSKTPHIVACRFPGCDHFRLVESLWRRHGILTSYIGPMNLLRLQMHEQIVPSDIDEVVEALLVERTRCESRTSINSHAMRTPSSSIG